MHRVRFFWLGVGCCLLAASGWGQPQKTVMVGGYKAHPTRILARFAEPREATSLSTLSTLKSLGLTVNRRYSLMPGAVALDYKPSVTLMSGGDPDPEAQAEALIVKMEVLRASGLFKYVEPDYYVTNYITEPMDERFVDGTLWGLRNLGQNGGAVGADVITHPEGGNTNAWDITTGSTNVIVAVVDTGIRYTHIDLRQQMWVNPGEIPGNGVDDDGNGYIDDIHGINAIVGSGNPMDDNDHGSHCSGTIGASANDAGVHVGVTWRVRLMGCKFLSADGGGFTADAISCINYATAMGAKVMNNSWGGGGFEQLLLDAIVTAHTNNVLFVAAAGNSAEDNDLIPAYPASYDVPNVVSVAALDRKDKLAYFSNYGKKTVHIGAPGVEIFSCTAGSDTSYDVFQGTSMAAPHVTGVAALILSASKSAMTNMAEVKERMLRTAVPVEDIADKTSTGGRVNATRALMANPDGNLEVSITPPNNAVVLVSTNLPVFVKVTDLFDVTNATVTAEVLNTNTVISFTNSGLDPDVASNDTVYSAYFNLTLFTNAPFFGQLDFRLKVKAPQKKDYTNIIHYVIVDRPANDMFAKADKVPATGAYGGALIIATNTFASMESREPMHAGVQTASRSLWWNWSPAQDCQAVVDTAGSSFPTLVGVYTAANSTNISTVTEVAAASGVAGKKQAYVMFQARQGSSYHIAVAGVGTNDYGYLRLRVEPNGFPDSNPPVVDVAYPRNGELVTANKIDINGTAFDPSPNASGVREVLVKINSSMPSSASGTTQWRSTGTLQPGLNTILVTSRDWSANVSTAVKVLVTYRPVEPPNDVFGWIINPSSPYYIKNLKGFSAVTNIMATKEYREPNHAGNEGGKSVWWTFGAPEDGVLTIDTKSSDFDTLLGLYLGDRVDALTTVAGNDDALPNSKYSKLTQAVRGGRAYRIAVDGFGSMGGKVGLTYEFVPTNVVTLTLRAVNGTISPGKESNDVVANTTLALAATPDPFYEFVEWTGATNSTENPLRMVVDRDMALEAVFMPHAFADDFETGGLSASWVTGGGAPWTVTGFEPARGSYCVRSGAIGNSQRSTLSYSSVFNSGWMSFDYRVSCEEGWDFFEFFVDGQLQASWTGEIDWTNFRHNLSGGPHTLEWVYRKDTQNADGFDAAFIDNLDLPFVTAPSIKTARCAQTLDGFKLVFGSGIQMNYLVEWSEDLQTWKPLASGITEQDETTILDRAAVGKRYRFYRVSVGE